jgi:putative ABC transport system substrate-binding protein
MESSLRLRRLGFTAGIALAIIAGPLLAGAQQPAKLPRIGVLYLGSPGSSFVEAFRQGLRQLGYVEGQNLAFEVRAAEWKAERLPGLAAELVGRGVDVIFTSGPEVTLRAAKEATSTIPIVVVAVDYDPVALGYAAGLRRPSGHITGVYSQQVGLTAKRLDLLKEAVPTVTRMVVFWDTHSSDQLNTAEGAGRALGMALRPVEFRDPPYDFDRAFREVARPQARTLLVLMSPHFYVPVRAIPDLAAQNKIPAMFGLREWAEAGGLMAYGPNLLDMFRRAATYVDKILKGAKPGDLPVEQPTRFELVINLKTAKALGLTIPQSILIRADQVIQ